MIFQRNLCYDYITFRFTLSFIIISTLIGKRTLVLLVHYLVRTANKEKALQIGKSFCLSYINCTLVNGSRLSQLTPMDVLWKPLAQCSHDRKITLRSIVQTKFLDDFQTKRLLCFCMSSTYYYCKYVDSMYIC